MKRSKLLLAMMATLLVMGLLVSCAAAPEEAPAAEEEAVVEEAAEEEAASWQIAAEDLKVALLLDGPVNDGGWNQGAYDGLVRVEEKYGVETAYTESVPRADMETVFSDYAARGFNVVMAHGFEFSDAAVAAAESNPNTIFIVTHGMGGMSGGNVATIQYEEEQISFALGVAAGLVSETGKLACTGGYEIPAIAIPFEAFSLGVKEVNPDAEVSISWLETWSDIAKMKEAATAAISGGVDVVMPVAVGANPGGFSAVEEADVWTVGYSGDAAAFAPDNTITSAIIDTGMSIELVVDEIVAGTFEPTDYWYGIADGVLYFADFDDSVSQDVVDTVNEWMDKIESGEFEVPVKMEF